MPLNTVLQEALSGASIRAFTAVRVELPGYPINLTDGSGFVSFPVDGVVTTFDSANAVFGTLASVGSITEALAVSAPRVLIAMMPPTANAVGALASVTTQGSLVRIWVGLINETTGLCIGVPELLWTGRLDTAKETLTENGRLVELDVASAFERLFNALESERLNRVWHQHIWPGETGLDFNIAALSDPMWGADAGKPRSGSTGFGGGSTGGGSTGGGGGQTRNPGGGGGGGGGDPFVDSFAF